MQEVKLTFLGATKTVTGSKYLLEDDGRNILIDCGLFQGRKELRLRNWEKLPFPAEKIDAVILTHAHLDHSGYIPLLVKSGFRGPVFCSEATFDLCKILLPDSGFIQEEDAARANRYGYSKHHPALPLYTSADAKAALAYFRPVAFGRPHRIGEEAIFTLHRAGHILGASFISYTRGDGTSVLFTGDMGRMQDPVMKAPAIMQETDYLVIESTYGDRLHDAEDPAASLEKIINDTNARGGSVIIPAFAVGRAQALLYHIYQLKTARRIPAHMPVYLDSPMAINATDLLVKHINDHRLPRALCAEICGIAEYVHTSAQSKALDNNQAVPKVIISASGMATGGRVLHHLKHYLGDARHTVLLAGYQAPGTRGDRLIRGEAEIKIHGGMHPVRAQIAQIGNMSAHADYEEILGWLSHFREQPRKIFITHGEEEAAESLRQKIATRFPGWQATVPDYLQQEEL